MSEKDFLSQFSGTPSKPDSFKEEVRKPVVKNKKPVNKWLIIGLVAGLIVLGILAYVLFFMPKISVPSFVGESKSDVAAWVKQQGIETSGIIFKEEYDFYTEKDTILSQDVEPGKKVTKKAKLTFGLSLGADPNERITVPGLMSMTKSEIQEWSKANKLTGVKIVSSYSDTVDEGNVIKLSNFNEDEFKRSSSLEVTVSKGPKPANVVKVEDFVGKTAIEAETWAKNNGLNFSKSEVYSEKDEPGKVISQAPSKNNEIKTGDAFTVVVSKGKAVYMPNMYEWTEEDITYWCGQNGIGYKTLPAIYDDEAAGECIEQYPAKGTLLKSGDRIEYRISLGKHVTLNAVNLDDLKSQISAANSKGANISLAESKDFSDTVEAGGLISYSPRVRMGDTAVAVISRGKNRWIVDYSKEIPAPTEDDKTHTETEYFVWNDIEKCHYNEQKTREMLETVRGGLLNCDFKYEYSGDVAANHIISISRKDGADLVGNSYLPDDVVIEIVVCDKSLGE